MNRRQFLKNSALATASLSLAPTLARAQVTGTNGDIRVAVVGLNSRGKNHLDNFAKPVLDTLFTSGNVKKLNGVLLPEVNDTWVFRLLLEKVEVKTPQEQGADVTISWHPSVTPDLSAS